MEALEKNVLQPTADLKKLHSNLMKKDGFEVPYDEFANDMQNENNLRRLHSNLMKKDGFEVPYEQFKIDMFGGNANDSKQQSNQNLQHPGTNLEESLEVNNEIDNLRGYSTPPSYYPAGKSEKKTPTVEDWSQYELNQPEEPVVDQHPGANLRDSLQVRRSKIHDEIYKIGEAGDENTKRWVKNIFRKKDNKLPYIDYEGDAKFTPTSEQVEPLWKENNKITHALDLLKKAEEYQNAPDKNNFSALWKGIKAPLAKDLLTVGLQEMERNLQIGKSLTGKEETDKQLVDAFRILKEVQANPDNEPSFLYQTGEVVSNMIPYVIQFALTRGSGAAVKESVNQALNTTVRKGLGKIAAKGAAYTAGAMGQAATMPIMYSKFGEEVAEGKGYSNAMLQAFLKTTGETFGENFGEVGQKFLTKTLAKNSKGIRSDLLKSIGWNGPWEYLEENVTNLWNTALTDEREWKDFWNWKEQGIIALSTSIIGAPLALQNKYAKNKVTNRYRKSEDKINSMNEGLSNQVFNAIDEDSPENTLENLYKVAEDNQLTKEARKDIFTYAQDRFRYNSMFVQNGESNPEETPIRPEQNIQTINPEDTRRAELQSFISQNQHEDGSLTTITDKDGKEYFVSSGNINDPDGTLIVFDPEAESGKKGIAVSELNEDPVSVTPDEFIATELDRFNQEQEVKQEIDNQSVTIQGQKYLILGEVEGDMALQPIDENNDPLNVDAVSMPVKEFEAAMQEEQKESIQSTVSEEQPVGETQPKIVNTVKIGKNNYKYTTGETGQFDIELEEGQDPIKAEKEIRATLPDDQQHRIQLTTQEIEVPSTVPWVAPSRKTVTTGITILPENISKPEIISQTTDEKLAENEMVDISETDESLQENETTDVQERIVENQEEVSGQPIVEDYTGEQTPALTSEQPVNNDVLPEVVSEEPAQTVKEYLTPEQINQQEEAQLQKKLNSNAFNSDQQSDIEDGLTLLKKDPKRYWDSYDTGMIESPTEEEQIHISAIKTMQEFYSGATLSDQLEEAGEALSEKESVQQAETEVNTTPTEAQKKAGNYKKEPARIQNKRTSTEDDGKSYSVLSALSSGATKVASVSPNENSKSKNSIKRQKDFLKEIDETLPKSTDKEEETLNADQPEVEANLKPQDEVYELIKDEWFANKDEEVVLANIDTRKLQREIKATFRKNNKQGARNWQEIDKAIHLYLDIMEKQDQVKTYWEQLSDSQKRLVNIALSLTDRQKIIAHEIRSLYDEVGSRALDNEIIHNILENYVSRTWDTSKKGGAEELFVNFSTETGHAKLRTLGSILEGWAKGYSLITEGATNNLENLRVEITNVIENKRLVNLGLTIQTADNLPLLSTDHIPGYKVIDHPNFTKWRKVKQVKPTKEYKGENFVITKDGVVFEKKKLYAPPKIAKNLNNILNKSSLSKKLPGVGTLTRINAQLKATILSWSFFHHMAFTRSYLLGSAIHKFRDINPVAAYKEGLNMLNAKNPEVIHLVRNGLTLGRNQEWDEAMIDQKSRIGGWLDKHNVAPAIREKIYRLHKDHVAFLFNQYGSGLKVKSALLEYHHLLKKYPGKDPDYIAKLVAKQTNADFGGLHLERLGRNKNWQHFMRLTLLAPDWTESNVQTMVKAFAAKDKIERRMYQRFWKRAFLRTAFTSVALNLALSLMSLWDEDDENGYWDEVTEKYKRAFENPERLNWLSVDVTFLADMMKGPESDSEDDLNKYFSVLGHFYDPVKFILAPFQSLKNKGSVLVKIGAEAYQGENWQGKRFTSFDELLGTDNKGVYKSSSEKYGYRVGDPKGGKNKGQLTRWRQTGDYGALKYEEIPSFILSTIRGTTPVPVQNGLAFALGEISAFDAISHGVGIHMKSKRTFSNLNKEYDSIIDEAFIHDSMIKDKMKHGEFEEAQKLIQDKEKTELSKKLLNVDKEIKKLREERYLRDEVGDNEASEKIQQEIDKKMRFALDLSKTDKK